MGSKVCFVGSANGLRWQLEASVPDERYERFLAKTREQGNEITSVALYGIGKRDRAKKERDEAAAKRKALVEATAKKRAEVEAAKKVAEMEGGAKPGDVDIEAMVRRCMKGDVDSSGAATQMDIHRNEYRMARYLVLLQDDNDGLLLPEEAERVNEAVGRMNDTGAISSAFGSIKDIVVRIYGDNRRGNSPWAAFQPRRAKWDRTFGALIEACGFAPLLDIAALTEKETDNVLKELQGALKDVNTLRRKVRGVFP